jgi:hypothetical protein
MDTKNIEYWKNANIDYAIFNFFCGGDSMGDTKLTFYDANSNPVEVDLSFQSLIEDMFSNDYDIVEVDSIKNIMKEICELAKADNCELPADVIEKNIRTRT